MPGGKVTNPTASSTLWCSENKVVPAIPRFPAVSQNFHISSLRGPRCCFKTSNLPGRV